MDDILKNIKERLSFLPKKDYGMAVKFFDMREFHALRELTRSAVHRISKNLESDSPKEEYFFTDISKLEELETLVDNYLLRTEPMEEDYDELDLDESFLL